MGAIQSSINKITGTLAAATVAGIKLAEGLDKKEAKSAGGKNSGIDAKMAQKARNTAMQKIKTIYNNKQLSQKAMSRRVGKVLDEYQGGKK